MKPLFTLMRSACLLAALLLTAAADSHQRPPDLTPADAEARLRLVHQLAREMNDPKLVDRVKTGFEAVKRLLEKGDQAEAEKRIRELEQACGVDPGGWSMGGLKIFKPSAELISRLKPLENSLRLAMSNDDADAVAGVTRQMREALGPQAGLPDARRQGDRAPLVKTTPPQAVDYFIQALESEKAARTIMEGRPLPDQMLRVYAGIVKACSEIRPEVVKHRPDNLDQLDRLVRGACAIMTRHQQPAGHFPFPDLRGKNIRFGDMTEKLLQSEPGAARDGWIVSVDPDGGSQFDTGECGTALLLAGKVYGNKEWTAAGLKAADWALAQPCVPNFNYNAFSISLLADAFRATGQSKYLDGAIRKWEVGVAPGQAGNGRWLDPHNARTVYHLIILRAQHDLRDAVPDELPKVRAAVEASTMRAVESVLDEFETMGVTNTSFALRELIRSRGLNGIDNDRLRRAIELTASVVVAKSVRDDRARFGVAPSELAALAGAWKNH